MKGWSRTEPLPDRQRLNLHFATSWHPELAEYVWQLPWGLSNEAVRILIRAGYETLKGQGQLPFVDVPITGSRNGVGKQPVMQPVMRSASQPAAAQPVMQPAMHPTMSPVMPPAADQAVVLHGETMSVEDVALLAELDAGLS